MMMTMTTTGKEAKRLRSVQRLASRFHKLCGHQLGEKHWYKHFEAWLWSAREGSAEEKTSDVGAVLPGGADACYDMELGSKLLKAKESPRRVASICEQLGIALDDARDVLRAKKRHKNSPATAEKMEDRDKFLITSAKTNVEITVRHYNKLKRLVNTRELVNMKMSFDQAVFCLLARYSALQGGHHRTGGYQASIHERCFDVLREDFQCEVECFASPFNCNLSRYCSMFPDLDRAFGSLGNFFEWRPTEGSFEANPPFSESIVTKMCDHIESLLRVADENTKPMSFVVIVPKWTERESWTRLSDSKWCAQAITLEQKDHGFCEGAQQLRDHTRRYRQSNHNTSVFFLQSERGARKWPVTDAKIERLRLSFRPMRAASHLSAEGEKKKKRGRSQEEKTPPGKSDTKKRHILSPKGRGDR